MELSAPAVLLIAFNRPDKARQAFEQIRRARPTKLYFACDGARPQKAGEADLVDEVRGLAAQVDWPCEVKTLFAAQNLGCGRGVSSAITWFLADAGEGIILEDDCLPQPSFFRFAAVMLDRHRHDEKVAVIAGTNLAEAVNLKASHGFSTIITCWGWATWRRAWADYQLVLKPITDEEVWPASMTPGSLRMFRAALDRIQKGDCHTWDYQFLIQILRKRQLTVVPAVNLILNTGFDGAGAHSIAKRPWWVPSTAYDPIAESWDDRPEVLANESFDRRYLTVAHASGWLKVSRSWLKLQYGLVAICRRAKDYLAS
jgi:hypothetical protein